MEVGVPFLSGPIRICYVASLQTARPEPNVRGTWGLLISCVLTLSLCVYTVRAHEVFATYRNGFDRKPLGTALERSS